MQKLYKVSDYVKFATVSLAEASHMANPSQWGRRPLTSVNTGSREKSGLCMPSVFQTWQHKVST